MTTSPGKRLREAILAEQPLQIVGVINAYSALLAKQVGYRALYLSGAGVANASYGWPDLGITALNDVLIDVERITAVSDLPLLVDADTGWGDELTIARVVRDFINHQVAGMHIEDQVHSKRCGHRPNKRLVDAEEMCDRIKAAVDARTDADFVIMARTDAVASEGLAFAIERAIKYVKAGADMIFAEAVTELADYAAFAVAAQVPILANITEFGSTPLFTLEELRRAQVTMALYPLSAFRAMSEAALKVYETIRQEGSQQSVLSMMQTREKLYEFLNYYQYEKLLDLGEKKHHE
jgi:methylisocitrate lyase